MFFILLRFFISFKRTKRNYLKGVSPLNALVKLKSIDVCSDNFSFQNNGIKKVHMLENNGFFGKTMGFGGKQCCFFFKAMFFDTTSHMIYFDYKAYAFYQNNYI